MKKEWLLSASADPQHWLWLNPKAAPSDAGQGFEPVHFDILGPIASCRVFVSDWGEGGCERGGSRAQLQKEPLHPSRGMYCTTVLRIRDPVLFFVPWIRDPGWKKIRDRAQSMWTLPSFANLFPLFFCSRRTNWRLNFTLGVDSVADPDMGSGVFLPLDLG
jgi:hypothetical protein